MKYDTLISVHDAASRIGDPGWLFFDCRYTLGDGGKGRRDYAAGHLPGAHFASLDDDLASPHVPGVTGRHPLPAKEVWVETLSRWGIHPATQIVAYDAGVGQSASAALASIQARKIGFVSISLAGGSLGRSLKGRSETNAMSIKA